MDNDTIAARKKKVQKRKKIYLVLGWPLILIGMGISLYKPAFSLGIAFIICGVIMRVLYYYINIELRSLERYEKLLDKTKLIFLTFFVIFTFSKNISAEVKIGDDPVELTELEWVEGEPVKISENDDDGMIYVLVFWAPWDKGSLMSLPILSGIHEKYKDDKITVIGITQGKKEKLTEYLESIKKKIEFKLASDVKGTVTEKYLGKGAGIPVLFVLGKDKEIIWKGSPLLIEPVLEKILKGNYDPDVEKQINDLQLKMQNRLQMEKIPEAIKIADSILELDPSNQLALRVRLFIFERNGKLDDAVSFMDSLIQKEPDEAQLYFIKLDLFERLNRSVEDREEVCEDIFEKFNSDHEILERLAWTAVSRMRFGTAPLPIILKASEKAVTMLIESKEQNPAKLANYLETQARVYYSIGKVSKAIEIQEKVIRLRKGDPAEKEATIILHYYQEALGLGEEK